MVDPISEYLTCLRIERGRSPRTIEAYGRDLADYASFLERNRLGSVAHADRAALAAYEADLSERGFAPTSVKRRLSAIKGLYRYLVREEVIATSPADLIAVPKTPDRLPDVLSIAQVCALMECADDSTPASLRDHALLEVLYGCGLRASEACGLNLADLALDEGYLRIRGKGGKERVAPISGAALRTLSMYLDDARRVLDGGRGKSSGAVFLNVRGGRITRQSLHKIVCILIRYAILSRLISSRVGPICELSKRCSATPTSRRLKSTRTLTARTSARNISQRTRVRKAVFGVVLPDAGHVKRTRTLRPHPSTIHEVSGRRAYCALLLAVHGPHFLPHPHKPPTSPHRNAQPISWALLFFRPISCAARRVQ